MKRLHFIKSILLLSISFLLLNCSSSRPYITSLQPAGNGFIVEKCKTQYNPFAGKISTEDCTQSFVGNGGTSNGGSSTPFQLNNNVK